jgi:protocatechuate 3,4-dioxygenase beta subunit
MRIFIAALLIITICTFSAVAEAQAVPDHMFITRSKNWTVADGAETSTITATVYDLAGNPIPAATVTFKVDAPWALSTMNAATDAFGKATTVFQPTIKSGTATIVANASVVEGGVPYFTENTTWQFIDHGTPQLANYIYPLNASVGGTTTIQVNVTDANGNPVDSRNVVETIEFSTSGSSGSGFWDGTGFTPDLLVPVDAFGVTRVTFLAAKSGSNLVFVQPPAPMLIYPISINAVNDGPPFAITQAVSPGGYPYPYTRTDGSKFRFVYTLLDQNGNPSGHRGLHITTSVPGEEATYTTNDYGVVAFYYQKDVVGLYTITATAVDNASYVTASQTVEFIAGDPTNMVLTASPQSMPSRDVKSDVSSTLFAKVVDEMGNPVEGELVTFTIWSYNIGNCSQTTEPSIENESTVTNITRVPITEVTDSDGLATVTFRPGAFTTNRSDPKYSYNAGGSAIVKATWGSVSHNIELQYKNYPYLSVNTLVQPLTVQVNDTVNISIQLKGDGWALQPKPIDVVLLTDRSGSMLFNETVIQGGWHQPDVITSESPEDRMVLAMKAADLFVDQMNSSDRIGLVSFGDLSSTGSDTNGWAVLYHTGNAIADSNLSYWRFCAGKDYILSNGDAQNDYNDDVAYVTAHYPGHNTTGRYYGNGMATDDLNLSYDKTNVKTIVNRMVPTGGTPLRYGIYEAVKMIVNDPQVLAHKRDDAVRAIVLLTDGDYNTGGDPEGGTGTASLPGIGRGSVIDWAKANNISIHTIALGSESAPVQAKLRSFADKTGGGNYTASSGLDLNHIYTTIAGTLHTQAGVGTTMDLAFHQIEVNGALVPAMDYLKYNCTYPYSTHVFAYNLTNPMIIDPAHQFIDQTADWNDDQSLHFDVGTIFIGGVWEANFSMKILRDGNIKILDSNSTIKFNDGSELPLPDTYITARPQPLDNGPEGIGIWVTNVTRTDAGTNPDYADIFWNLTYTGLEPSVKEYIDFQQEGTTTWIPGPTRFVDPTTTSDSAVLDISSLPSGIWTVRVTAHADDAGDSAGVTQFTIVKGEKAAKIKIK